MQLIMKNFTTLLQLSFTVEGKALNTTNTSSCFVTIPCLFFFVGVGEELGARVLCQVKLPVDTFAFNNLLISDYCTFNLRACHGSKYDCTNTQDLQIIEYCRSAQHFIIKFISVTLLTELQYPAFSLL